MTSQFTSIIFLLFILGQGTPQQLEDPNIFIEQADQILRDTYSQCQHLSDDIFGLVDASLDKKLKVINDLEQCGKNLEGISKNARQYNVESIENLNLRQALLQLTNLRSELKLGSHVMEIGTNLNAMSTAFDKQNIEYYDDDQLLSLKDIERMRVLTRSDSIDELNYYWKVYNHKVSSVAEELFFDFVKIVRRVAKNYNITATEFWYPNYSETLLTDLDQLMQGIKPFYEQLQGYIRYKILRKFGAGVVKPNGPIPEHLYKQVRSRAWTSGNNYFNDDFPLDKLPSYQDIFKNAAREPDAKEIVDIAENFYNSIGFDGFSEDFKQKNIIKSHDERENCETKVYDKMPYNVTLIYCNTDGFDAFVAEHEHLGRIHSALQKKRLPFYFYDGNVFGESFGRAVKLSALSPKHFKTIGLANDFDFTSDVKANINFRLAVETMFAITQEYIDMRVIVDFLTGKVKRKHLNRHYWKVLEEYAGVEPPIDRHEDSFDLPYPLIVKFIKNQDLIRDFENSVLAFQFYKAACDHTDHSGSLSDCDFYNNKEVGALFKELLSKGSSKPFSDIIAPVLPKKKLDVDGLLAFFETTQIWLKNYNQMHNVSVGWISTNRQTFKELFRSERDALLFISQASDKIYEHFNQITEDMFEGKSEGIEFEDDTFGNMFWKVSKSAVAASDLKDISLTAKKISASNFKDKSLKRALKNLARIGDLFVLGGDLEMFLYNKGQLYNTSTDKDVRKYKTTTGETVALYPDIRNVFLHSHDKDELKYYWTAWRDRNAVWARSLLTDMFQSFKTAAQILEISVSEFWFKHYNTAFIDKMEKVILALRPLYSSIHSYVKARLVEKYGNDILSNLNGAIPDHLVEQVLLQIWTPESIVEENFKFSELPPHDRFIEAKNLTSLEWLKISNQFYASMGFKEFDETFWNQRIKAQANSKTSTNCHAKIFDSTPKIFMKYCDQVDYRKYLQGHGYMGRLHYASEKSELPAYFFDSYFLEYPVGEAVILSASTPAHSMAIGLFNDFPITDNMLLNRQIRMAIHTVFNLHKYFVHTKVISEYLKGEITENEMGKYYWKYMMKYAGVEAPVNRNEDAFDFPFEFYTDLEQNHQLKKFVSEVLGYQMYEALCRISGFQGVLSNCDFYGSVKAGDALRNMMQMGSSKPRKVVLRALFPENGLSAHAMMNYYEPLTSWLKKNTPQSAFI